MLARSRCRMTKQRSVFSAEFKREAADLVLKQSYKASRSLGVGESALRRWVFALQSEWWRAVISPAFKTVRAHQRGHHHQPQLLGMVECVWRRQDDHSVAGSADTPLPYRRNGQRVLPPATQHLGRPDKDQIA